MQKVLITGGSGFIGSHLCEAYLSAGYKVAVVDNFSTGIRQNIPKRCQLFEVSIEDEKGLNSVFESFKPDVVNHHAAQTKVRVSNAYPHQDAKTNVMGLLNVLALSQKFQVKSFIFASSAAVYGAKTSFPISERSHLSPLSVYGISKVAGEQYVTLFGQQSECVTTIFRYSNVYGPRQSSSTEGGVVAILTDALLKNKQPVITGDGKQTRDFIFVGDIAKINVVATEQKLAGVFNISTEVETSINQLYTEISQLLTIFRQPIKEPNAFKGVRRSCLSSSKLRSHIHLMNLTPLKSGLKATVEWFKNEKE